tara:strand:- start:412639 stop:413355 length:717 start_codon:yes stop_codon:yes gene_type:complete
MNLRGKQVQVIVLLSVLLVGFNHCMIDFQPSKTKSNNTTSSTSAPTTNNNSTYVPDTGASPSGETTEEEEIVAQQVDVGVKNFDQINNSFSALTGVSVSQNNVRNLFEDVATQLPTENDVKSFLGSNQVAVAKLASEYCNRLVNDGNLRSQIWPNLDFGRSPSSEFNNTNIDLVINQTIDHFWGPNVQQFDRQSDYLEMRDLFNDLLVGENMGSSATTRNTMMGICTAALASAHVTLL